MFRRKLWIAAAATAGLVLVPSVALAIFSSTSSSSTAAITGTNSSTGPGVLGRNTRSTGGGRGLSGSSVSNDGLFGVSTATSGTKSGVMGSGAASNGQGGLFVASSGTSVGFPAGVIGQAINSINGGGVVGVGILAGVVGDTGAVSNGSFGGLFFSDVGISGQASDQAGHLMVGENGNVAGTCTVGSLQTSAVCNFHTPFVSGTTPIVVVTPRTDPGGTYWVSAPTTTGFTLNKSTASANATTFNFVVVGLNNAQLGIPSAQVQSGESFGASGGKVQGLRAAHAPR